MNVGTLKVATAPLMINDIQLSGNNVALSGTGGTPNGNYAVLATSNLAEPPAGWTALTTNQFDGTGGFSVTNPISSGTPELFYRIKRLTLP